MASIVIDQISHAWAGEGGLLEYVDTLKAQSRNSFSPWQKATPEQNRLVDTMLRSPCHIIATMRAKSEWVLEEQIVDGRKKNVPRKIGMAPVQRDGIEYEFTTMLDLENGSNTATASKDRSSLFAGITTKLDEEWGAKLRAWLTSGAAPNRSRRKPAADGHGAACAPESARRSRGRRDREEGRGLVRGAGIGRHARQAQGAIRPREGRARGQGDRVADRGRGEGEEQARARAGREARPAAHQEAA
jgi:hypothetical protein